MQLIDFNFSLVLCLLSFLQLNRPHKTEEIPGSSEQALSSILCSSSILDGRNVPPASGGEKKKKKSNNKLQKVYLNVAVYFYWRLSYLPL